MNKKIYYIFTVKNNRKLIQEYPIEVFTNNSEYGIRVFNSRTKFGTYKV